MLGHWPAACQVEPDVSSFFSTKIVSVQPSRARWYKRLAPIIPPPMTTMRAFVFIGHNKLIPHGQATQYFGTFGHKFFVGTAIGQNPAGCGIADVDLAARL